MLGDKISTVEEDVSQAEMLPLPKGWRWLKLNSVSKIISGFAFKSSDFVEFGVPCIKISNVGYSEFHIKNQQYLPSDFLNIHKKFQIFGGDLIIALTRPITHNTTKICKYPSNKNIGLLNQRVAKIEAEKINKEYLFWYFQTNAFKDYIRSKFSETLQPNLSPVDLGFTLIPVPPNFEHEEIIQKIEKLFSELDKGVENLKTAQLQLEIYRQAVIKSTFADVKIKTSVGKLFDFLGGGTPSKQEFGYWNGEINWASVKDIKGDFLNGTQDKITQQGLNNSASNIANPNDVILITRISPGKVIITNIPTAVNQDLKIVKPKFKTTSKYVYYLFKSIEWECVKLSSGTTVLGINLTNLKAIEVPEVDFDSQNKIVQEIESRLSVCDNIEETIQNSLQQAKALKQSILKKAFEGKLVKANTHKEAKVVSINAMRDVWERKVLAGKIIFACHKERSFGTTKFQKLLYLCEQHAQLEFDTHYVKQTAGPLDSAFIYPFIREAEKSGWFVQETEIAPFHFEPLNGLGHLTNDYPKFFKAVDDKINSVIGLLKDKNTDDSELIATIYAIWNNYIIQQQVMDAEILINEVYDWSKSKAKFTKPTILATWKWMKEVGLVPVGFGKLIEK